MSGASPARPVGSLCEARRVERIDTADGVSLAVHVEGEGTPVVLLHGFPDSSYLWRKQARPAVRSLW